MSHLPLNIDLRGMEALVVGGGNVASRKIESLLEAHALVRVVSPELTPRIRSLAEQGCLSARSGRYCVDDLQGALLVVAATNDPETNRNVADDARRQGRLVCVTSDPAAGNCSFAALLRRGDLTIGVSTGGGYPGFAALIRDLIAEQIGEVYGEILQTLAAEREKLLTESAATTYYKQLLRSRAEELVRELTERKESAP